MKKLHLPALLALAVTLTAAQNASPTKPPAAKTLPQPMAYEKAFPMASQIADRFLNGTGADLFDKMTPTMQQAVGNDASAWSKIAAGIVQQIGKVTQSSGERMLPAMELQTYTRLVRTSQIPVPLVVSVALTPDGKIAGLAARPVPNPAESRFLDYKDKTAFRFPLTGEWTIYQGGRTVYDNYHAAYPDERFAYDIMAFREDSMYRAGGSSLDDFYGFGQPVVAAAAGTVMLAEDKYDDNPIGQLAPSSPKQGNNIVIDHGNGEFSMYAHLKRGSLKVNAGDKVKSGQAIALVGNSGNSPIPHLHFHVQNTASWFQGDGLPSPFRGVTVNGKKLDESEPVRGDLVKAE